MRNRIAPTTVTTMDPELASAVAGMNAQELRELAGVMRQFRRYMTALDRGLSTAGLPVPAVPEKFKHAVAAALGLWQN